MVSIFKLEEIFKDKDSSFLEKEEKRLKELYSLNLIHTPTEQSFDRITELASRIFQVPISLISLLTEDLQWFKSCVGLTGDLLNERSTKREESICQYVVIDGEPLVIEDTLQDPRFKHNPLVVQHHIRFYAGAPIITKHHNIIGTVCIIDVEPRTLTEAELQTLIDLSNWIKTEIELRTDLLERTMNEQSIRTLYEVTSNNSLTFDEKLNRLLKIGCDRFHLSDGHISKITGEEYKILQMMTKSSSLIKAGDLLPLNDFCAGNIMASLEPVHIKQSAYKNQSTMFNEYIGAPIFVNNAFYGTFCFFSKDQTFRAISNSDLEFLQLMTQWVGFEIERLQVYTELRESQERFQQITNNIKEAFWIFEVEKNEILFMSSAWEEISGRTCKEFYEDNTLWINTILPEDRDNTLENFQNISKNIEFEYRLIHSDGTIRWIRNRIVPILNKEGRVYRLAGVAEDITDAKLNEDLIRKWDKLSAVSQLAASIAHEIRNPLTSVKGFMQLNHNEISSFKELILSELGQIEDFINEILILANSHLGIQLNHHNVIDMMSEVLQATEDVSQLFNINFEFDPQANVEIVCDENQLKQVYQNIISNAIEAMPNGGTIHIVIGMEDEKSIYISVKDHGVGIAQDRIAKLGEPYYSNKEKGSGLGLMISYKIVQNHKGKILFTSELGKGTTVKIILPIEHHE
ncbi:hypothetical protein CJ195_00190 [Bacillus sp. UMB0899]|nr:hypothetical protein CJ195_00190 [Bacillus sp. UMB0899]